MKKPASNIEEKIKKLFETKTDNSIPNDYNPKKVAGVFDDKYI